MTFWQVLTLIAAAFMVASLVASILFWACCAVASRADDTADQLAHDLADDAWLTAATNSALSGKLPVSNTSKRN